MNYKIIADYHIHCNLVDRNFLLHAKGTIKENAIVAMKNGLKEIAITDHGTAHFLLGMKKESYSEMRRIIDEINQEYVSGLRDFRVLLGVEANIINSKGEIDIDDEIIQHLDLISVGYHPGASKLDAKFNYTQAAIKAMEKYDIAILHHPRYGVNPNIIEIGKVARKTNTAIELNEKHSKKDKESLRVDEVRLLKKLGVKFSLGSDSHIPGKVGKFNRTLALAIRAGLTNDDILNARGQAHNNLKLLNRGV
ncbi:PHP domain-containing protein [Tissierella creatinini]|nr:PHP domain-containing protein [Tissierella creatinini]TJX62913.1 PHP domain-containing protein [Soehngenia saccharolytica]